MTTIRNQLCYGLIIYAMTYSAIIDNERPLIASDEFPIKFMASKIISGVRTPFWMAYHDINSNLNGASWYKSAWFTNSFECLDLYDHILDVIPCREKSSWVIQIGAHLGIFPQQGAARGCQAISVEGSGKHIPLIKMTAALNDHKDRHHVIHAAAGITMDVQYFGLDSIYKSMEEIPQNMSSNLERVSVIPIDIIVQNYTVDRDDINIMIIDVEGYENEVLLGAARTIADRRVLFFNIEVWLRKNDVDIRQFHGLELLERAGYVLYLGRNHPIKNRDTYRLPKPITTKVLATSKRVRSKICNPNIDRKGNKSSAKLPKYCLFDLHVLHPNLSRDDIFTW